LADRGVEGILPRLDQAALGLLGDVVESGAAHSAADPW
jgi:hypothetical protein